MNNLKDYVNWKLTHADKTSEAEGYPLTMENCKRMKKMKELKIYGNSIQDGTPTPDTPIEVVSVGDLIKNLFDINAIEENKYVSSNDGETYDSSASNISDYIPVKANQYYCLHYDCETPLNSNTRGICFYDTNKTFLNGEIYAVTDKTKIISPKQDGYVRFTYDKSFTNIQLEEGETVTPIEFFGKYKIPVVVRSVNLLEDAREIYKSVSQYEELTEDGRECVRFVSGATVKYKGINFKENTQYTISFDCKVKYKANGGTVSDMGIAIFYTDGTYKGAFCTKDDVWRNIKITSQAGKTISSIGIYSYQYKNWIYVDINTYQIEEGTAATEYEPYVEPVTTNIFLDEPLCKIGNYTDYIDFKESKVIRKNYRQLINSSYGASWTPGTNAWQRDEHYDTVVASFFKYTPVGTIGLCNRFSNGNWTWSGNSFPGNYIYVWSNKNLHLIIQLDYLDGITKESTSAEKINAIKSFLDSHQTYVVYPVQTPIEEPLNIDLPKLNAKTSIIEVDTSLAPSNAYGKYIKK